MSLFIIQIDTLILPDQPHPTIPEFRNTKLSNNNFTPHGREGRRLTRGSQFSLTSGVGWGSTCRWTSDPLVPTQNIRGAEHGRDPRSRGASSAFGRPESSSPRGMVSFPRPIPAAGPAGPHLQGGSSPAAPRPGGGRWASGGRGRVFTNKGAGARGGGAGGAGRDPRDTHPARCRPSRPGQPPPAPAPGSAALRPPPPPWDPARAAAAATGTRPHNASLSSPPPAHTAPRHVAAGGRADEPPKT